MPIVIYSRKGPPKSPPRKLALLCGGEWTLPTQVSALETWLHEHKRKIKKGSYVADIGFTVRKDAGGGGSALSIEMMHTIAALGITLFLSEYPAEARKTKSNQTVQRTEASRFAQSKKRTSSAARR